MSETIKRFFLVTLPDTVLALLPRLFVAVLVLIVGFSLIKTIVKTVKKAQSKRPGHQTARTFLNICLNIALKTLVILIAASVLGFPMNSAITVLASAGAAIALALQSSLSNIASGLLLIGTNAYQIGDYVESNGQSGTVKEIGLFHTKLITSDNRHVLIPNSNVASSPLIDYSNEETRRIEFTVGVGYNSNIDEVKQLLIHLANQHPLVLQDPAPMARLAEMGDSSLDFTFRVWVLSGDYWTVKFDLNEQIVKALDEKKIAIPYPQMDIHVDAIRK